MTKVKNPNYLISIKDHSTGYNIDAYLPEALNVRAASNWEPSLATAGNDVLSAIPGLSTLSKVQQAWNIGNSALSAGGYNVTPQVMTHQIWQGSEPLEFQFTLLFDADSDPEKEVMEPTIRLLQLVNPVRINAMAEHNGVKIDNFVLKAPGPTPFEPNRERISLFLGKIIYIQSVIIPSVDVTYDVITDSNGTPISAKADVVIRTTITPDRKQIAEYFKRNGAGGSS